MRNMARPIKPGEIEQLANFYARRESAAEAR
jgi:hypothetical protein